MPKIDSDYVIATLNMPQGTPVEATARVTRRMWEAAERIGRELEEEGEPGVIRHVLVSVGEQPLSARRGPAAHRRRLAARVAAASGLWHCVRYSQRA